MNPTRRLIMLVIAVAVLAVGAFTLPLGAVPSTLTGLGPLAPIVGVVIGAGLLIALVPRTPVSLACGLLFGPWVGAVCALLVALLAAAVTFVAGRWLGREFVAIHAGRHWIRIEGWVDRGGVLAVAAFRALPIGPYGLSGYAYGASGVRIRDYALGTLIAGAPSAVSYALLGAAVAKPGSLNALSIAPLAFGLLLSGIVVVRARRVARSTAQPGLTVRAGDPGR